MISIKYNIFLERLLIILQLQLSMLPDCLSLIVMLKMRMLLFRNSSRTDFVIKKIYTIFYADIDSWEKKSDDLRIFSYLLA